MKKHTTLLSIISILGTLFSIILLIQHFYPQSSIANVTCSIGAEDSCFYLSMSGYSSIAGLPIAALGLFFYLFILSLFLLANFAEGEYVKITIAIVLPLISLALVIDILLFSIILYTRLFCIICISTYIINIALLVITILWRNSLNLKNKSIKALLLGSLEKITSRNEGKALIASFTMFTILLLFSVISVSKIINLSSVNIKDSTSNINNYVENFYKKDIVDNIPINSPIRIGPPDAEITIIVFTDYLCSACFRFHYVEKELSRKFPEKLKFVYFLFPLDQSCNDIISRTFYINSCIAADAVLAASQLGILKEYVEEHFKNYEHIAKIYSEKKALSVFRKMRKHSKTKITEQQFNRAMNSDNTSNLLQSHIELSKKFKIKATPTIFLLNRKIKGYPSTKILETIIIKKLKDYS